MKLSIIIPVYNEAAEVEQLLHRVTGAPLPGAVEEREILLVDDGSTDGTGEILDRYHDGRIIRVHHSVVNCGKGTSVRIGLRLARGDVALIQDADLEYDPSQYPELLEPLLAGRCHVVYGSRFAGVIEGMSFWHRLGNRVLTLATNLLFGSRLTDAYTGYKVLRRPVFEALELRSRDFDIEAEITARVLQRGFLIEEVPIRYRGRTDREGKKIRKWDGFLGLLSLLRYRFLG